MQHSGKREKRFIEWTHRETSQGPRMRRSERAGTVARRMGRKHNTDERRGRLRGDDVIRVREEEQEAVMKGEEGVG